MKWPQSPIFINHRHSTELTTDTWLSCCYYRYTNSSQILSCLAFITDVWTKHDTNSHCYYSQPQILLCAVFIAYMTEQTLDWPVAITEMLTKNSRLSSVITDIWSNHRHRVPLLLQKCLNKLDTQLGCFHYRHMNWLWDYDCFTDITDMSVLMTDTRLSYCNYRHVN